jgi:hypothetical protein
MASSDTAIIKKEYKLGYEAGKDAAKSVMSPTDPMHRDGDVSWQDFANMPKCQWPHVWRSGFVIGYYEGNEDLVPLEHRGFHTQADLMNKSIWGLT